MAERLGLPVVGRQRRERWPLLAEHRHGAARGDDRRRRADASAPASAAAILVDGEVFARRHGRRRPSSATWSSTPTGRPARATARTTAASRRSPRAPRSAREAPGARRGPAESAPRPRARRRARRHRARSSPSWPTTATRRRSTRWRAIGRWLGRRDRRASSNIFNPEVVVDRRRRDRAPASCCSARRARRSRARALPPVARPACGSCPRASAHEAGMLGRRATLGLRRALGRLLRPPPHEPAGSSSARRRSATSRT